MDPNQAKTFKKEKGKWPLCAIAPAFPMNACKLLIILQCFRKHSLIWKLSLTSVQVSMQTKRDTKLGVTVSGYQTQLENACALTECEPLPLAFLKSLSLW